MNLPAAAAAAAAVSIFYLLVFCSPVSSSLTIDHGFVRYRPIARKYVSGSPLITKIDGGVVTQCSIRWVGGYTTHGHKLYLLGSSPDSCYECGPCTPTGIRCVRMYRSCPHADSPDSSGSGSGEEIFI